MPMLGSFGPQSQPKWQGALRRYGPPGERLVGRSSRGPRRASLRARDGGAEDNAISLSPAAAAGHVPAPRPEHVVGAADGSPLRRTSASVSRPSKTRSTRSSAATAASTMNCAGTPSRARRPTGPAAPRRRRTGRRSGPRPSGRGGLRRGRGRAATRPCRLPELPRAAERLTGHRSSWRSSLPDVAYLGSLPQAPVGSWGKGCLAAHIPRLCHSVRARLRRRQTSARIAARPAGAVLSCRAAPRRRHRTRAIARATLAIDSLRRSSVVERAAVNRLVVGSNPTAGATHSSGSIPTPSLLPQICARQVERLPESASRNRTRVPVRMAELA